MNRNYWHVRLLGIVLLTLVAVGGYLVTDLQSANASFSWLTQAETKYPTIVGTPLDDCSLCHTVAPTLNSYGTAFKNSNHSFTAIENLDSDSDNFTNIEEINAHTFPGDKNSHPIVAPTATSTKAPPTATRTQAPATATRTTAPPTATRTQAPPTATWTQAPPTATRTQVLPTATFTQVPPSVTWTQAPPTAVMVGTSVPPTATSTRAAPTTTSVPPGVQATATPRAFRRITFRGAVLDLPATQNWIGDWQVGTRLVHTTSETRILSSGEEDDRVAVQVGAYVSVQGVLLADGSVNARYIIVLNRPRSEETHNVLTRVFEFFRYRER